MTHSSVALGVLHALHSVGVDGARPKQFTRISLAGMNADVPMFRLRRALAAGFIVRAAHADPPASLHSSH